MKPKTLLSLAAIMAGISLSANAKATPLGSVSGWGHYYTSPDVPSGVGISTIAAGGNTSLALKTDGSVVAWGNNSAGQCIVPTGLTEVVTVAEGDGSSFALKADGTVIAWGGSANSTLPSGLQGVIALASGGSHSLALRVDGMVVAWGGNSSGQSTVPTNLNGVVAVAAGYATEAENSLALESDGTVVAWGDNSYGQSTVPAALANVTAIAAGGGHCLALRSDGSVVGWGLNNAGQATPPVGLSGVIAIAAGGIHSLALKADGTVVGWGGNNLGQSTVPSGLNGVVAIAAGSSHSLALKVDGTVVGWGANVYGQSTTPTTVNAIVGISDGASLTLALKADGTVIAWGSNSIYHQSTVPSGLAGVMAVAVGGSHSLALKTNGTVVAWGSNISGESTVPEGLNGVVAIAAGYIHSLALKTDGTVLGWGDDSYGQTFATNGLAGITAIAAGVIHSLALKPDGSVVAEGDNSYGQCTVPTGLSGVMAIAAGGLHSLALRIDGTVVAWGSNASGESTVPSGLNGVIAIAAGYSHSLALKADGTVVAWGDNSLRETLIPSGLTGVVAIAAGDYHSMAIVAANAPVIINQPQSQMIPVGSSASFAVSAAGSPLVSYQWRYNGQNIPGATSTELTLDSAIAANSGYYSVVVSSKLGSVTSAVASLVVYALPVSPQPTTPMAMLTSRSPDSSLVAAPAKPTSAQLVVFTGGGLVNPNKMTIVLTHGWQSSSLAWPADMADTLKAQGLDANANVIAWDWRDDANNILEYSTARTTSQGNALGANLLATLGAGYNFPIHFVGHSLGTMVNCRAADYIHGDVQDSPGANDTSKRLSLGNTQMTMFDEAEVQNLDPLSGPFDLLFGDPNTPQVWRKVVPDHYSWMDNYISMVGIVHKEAANALLWRDDQLGVVGAHGYSCLWYSNSIVNAYVSQMGNRWSFERTSSLNGAPSPDSCFLQALNSDPLTLQLSPSSPIAQSLLAFPTLASYRALTGLGASVENLYLNGIQYAGNLVANTAIEFTAPSGQPVFTGTANSTPAYYLPPLSSAYQANWGLQFTLQSSSALQTSGQLSVRPSDAGINSNNAVYAWIPVSIPSNAAALSFQFEPVSVGTNAYITMAMSNQNYFTMESEFLQDSEWTASGILDISVYAGQQVQMFFSLNTFDGSTPSGQLNVRAIQFYAIAPTDSVGDGIADSWRAQYFSSVDPTGASTNYLSCATCDADGTGQNNMFKYLAGLNPTNTSSMFRIVSLAVTGSDVVVVWQGGGSRTNVVQVSNAMSISNVFSDASSAMVLVGSGDVLTNWVDIGGATNAFTRYYRVRIAP